MKWIVRAVVAIAAAAALVALVGWMLPVQHEASRSALIPRAPDQVYATIADVSRYPDWFEGVNRVDMLPAAGERVRFREHTTHGTIVMEIVEARPPSRLVTRIADPDQPFGGTWTFEILPEGPGSRVTITERGEVYNPVFRFMARFVFGHTATIDACLRSLERHERIGE